MLNIIEINNFNAPELDVYARYTEAQLLNKDRPEDGLFIAESPKVIGRALDAGYIPVSVLVEKKQMEENEENALCIETPTTGRFQETLRGKEQDCHFGRCDESNECRSNLSFGSSDAYGCSVTDFRMQQSIVSKSIQSEYGNGVSDSMDIYSG